MTFFTVDRDACIQDGLCNLVCPRGLIKTEEKSGYPLAIADAEELCISCGHCVAICPVGAVSIAGMDAADCPSFEPDLLPGPEQMRQLIRGRRSIRNYKDRPVDRGLLTEIIELARYAPTAKNSQLLEWLVIDDKEVLNQLAEHAIDWMRNLVDTNDPAAEALAVESVIAAWDKGYDAVLRHAPDLVVMHGPAAYKIGTIDSAISLSTFELEAFAWGLGSCWAGFFMIAAAGWKPLRDALQLPEGRVVTGALMVGEPTLRYSRLAQRKPPVIQWR